MIKNSNGMGKYLSKIFALFMTSFIVLFPVVFVFAANSTTQTTQTSSGIQDPRSTSNNIDSDAVKGTGLIPCAGADCDFPKLMQLINNLMTYALILAIPTVALVTAWAGYIYITKSDSPGDQEKARGMFVKVLWGFVIILGAWVAIKTVLGWILTSDFLFLFKQ